MKEPQRRLALAASILLPLGIFAGIVALTDRMFFFSGAPEGRERRAALAIRDDVPAVQKWVSKAFTRPHLERSYARSWYFTQSEAEDQKHAFLEALMAATDEHDAVDLFLLAHSNWYVGWVRELPARNRAKIRLVYNTGCGNARQSSRWLDLGVGTYVGHQGLSDSPTFYVYFMRRWTDGASAGEAVAASNARMKTLLERTELLRGGKRSTERVYRGSVASAHGHERQAIDGGL